MSITVNIGGVQKAVSVPSVNIGGTWKTVNTVSNNINGIWCQSYPDAWAIKIYRYGSLVNTLYVTKGQYITLTPTASIYSDDAFYGYSVVANSVTRTYTGSQRFKPTGNMSLYCIYSFTATGTTMQHIQQNGTAGQTLTITNAVPNTQYSVFESISTPWWEVVQSDPSSTTIITHTSTETTTKIDNATTNGTISYTFSNFQSTAITGPYGVTGQTSWSGWVDYWAYVTATGTKYRVVSHDNPSYIKLYSYGTLIRTISVTEGMAVVAGSAAGVYSNDTFYGWATSAGSTAMAYTSISNITPHGTLNLYAVYSYTVQEQGFAEVTSSSSTNQTVTTAYTGLVTVTFTYSGSTPGGSISGGYTSLYHYCKIGSTQLSGNYSGTINSGTQIVLHGGYVSTTNASVTYYTAVRYPAMVTNTHYRS